MNAVYDVTISLVQIKVSSHESHLYPLSLPLEESSDEHNSWEAAGRLIKNVFVRIDYTLTNFVQIDDHRTRRRRRRDDSSEREGRTEKNSIWIMHGSREEEEEGPTEAQGKARTLFRTHVSLLPLVSLSRLWTWSTWRCSWCLIFFLFLSCPLSLSLFSVCNVCVLCYCPCGWVQYTWQDTQSVYCLSFWFSWWFCWWKKSVCLVSCYIMSIDTHKEIPIQVLMTSKDMPPFPKQYNVRGKYHVKVTWLSPSPSVDNNRRSKQWCFCKQHQQQQETRV